MGRERSRGIHWSSLRRTAAREQRLRAAPSAVAAAPPHHLPANVLSQKPGMARAQRSLGWQSGAAQMPGGELIIGEMVNVRGWEHESEIDNARLRLQLETRAGAAKGQ